MLGFFWECIQTSANVKRTRDVIDTIAGYDIPLKGAETIFSMPRNFIQ